MQTKNGVKLLLSTDYTSRIKDNEALNFSKHVEEINLIQDITRLNTPLSEEASHTLQKHFTNKAAIIRRIALKDTKLHNGTKIPKGTKLIVSTSKSWDTDKYPNPEKFNSYRFLRMRKEQGLETAQFVSTTPNALGFGMGKHACPGRFFAANELKIALSHILLKYDFKLAPGAPTDPTFQALY
ncbi:ent-kaurene oxidase [Colletotrichum filicis]|nr:ent-kaurene oxidase [Colletotrichum filicis]